MLARNAVRPRALRSLASLSSPSSSWLLSSPSRPTSAPSSASSPRGVSSTRPPCSDAQRATNTISSDEIAHFSRLSAHWWDPTGEFGLLHRMNPARVEFLKGELLRVQELEGPRWLDGKDVLDVGCGGGIFAESLARLGANTLAIDASGSNVTTAQTHAALDPSLRVINSPFSSSISPPTSSSRNNTLEYRHTAAEKLVEEGKTFDVVCAMEVVEHVEDPRGFLECLMQLTKPGGHLLLSTISRTPLARLLTITLAEDVLRLVTPGTHTYHKYLKPSELRDFFVREKRWTDFETRGCPYDPISGKWRLLEVGQFGGAGELVNYFAGVRRPLE